MMIFNSHTLSCIVVITINIVVVSHAAREVDQVPVQKGQSQCVCGTISDRPDVWDKVATARWMVHNIDWGVLTTISSRKINVGVQGDTTSSSTGSIPFGNVYSFVDGSCTNSTGIPYFYGTYMDQSLQDMKHNSIASLTLSEASIDTSCMRRRRRRLQPDVLSIDTNPIRQACRIAPETPTTTTTHHHQHHQQHHDTATISTTSGDPESPICARLTLTGMLEVVAMDSLEFNDTLYDAFHVKHPQMSHWPVDHNWMIFKLHIYDIWLIDYFGGATTTITPDEYFRYNHPDDIMAMSGTSDKNIESNDPV